MLRPGQDGVLEFTLPIPADSKFAQFAVEDTGLVVKAVLDDKAKYLGKRIVMTGDLISPAEMREVLKKRTSRSYCDLF